MNETHDSADVVKRLIENDFKGHGLHFVPRKDFAKALRASGFNVKVSDLDEWAKAGKGPTPREGKEGPSFARGDIRAWLATPEAAELLGLNELAEQAEAEQAQANSLNELVRKARELYGEVRQSERHTVETAWELGGLLLEIKAETKGRPRGTFGDLLRMAGIGERSAQDYMKLATETRSAAGLKGSIRETLESLRKPATEQPEAPTPPARPDATREPGHLKAAEPPAQAHEANGKTEQALDQAQATRTRVEELEEALAEEARERIAAEQEADTQRKAKEAAMAASTSAQSAGTRVAGALNEAKGVKHELSIEREKAQDLRTQLTTLRKTHDEMRHWWNGQAKDNPDLKPIISEFLNQFYTPEEQTA